MNRRLAISETSVADLLIAAPQALRFFVEQGTACAICPLARFCTLEEVVITYDLDKNDFLEKLANLKVQKPL